MSSENTTEQLERLRTLCQNREWELALEAAIPLLKDDAPMEIWSLQTTILTHLAHKGDWRPQALRKALDNLLIYDTNDSYAKALDALNTVVRAMVDHYYLNLEDTSKDLPLPTLEKFLYLAPHFPAVRFLRGAVEALILERINGDTNTRAKMRRLLDMLQLERKRTGEKGILNTAGSRYEAVDSLTKAFWSLPEGDELRAFAARSLAQLQHDSGKLHESFEWLKRASALGLDVREPLDALLPKLSQHLRQQVYGHLDQLLSQGDFEAAAAQAQALYAVDASPEALVRWGDAAFALNRLEVAQQHYQAGLNCLEQASATTILSDDAIGIFSQLTPAQDSPQISEDTDPIPPRGFSSLREKAASERLDNPLGRAPVSQANYPGARYGIPPMDTTHRLRVGLLVIHQQRGEIEPAKGIFLSLLTQPDLPQTIQEKLLKTFEEHEQQVHQAQIQHLRTCAQQAVEVGDWNHAAEHFYALTCLPGAAQTDMAWLALASFHHTGNLNAAVHWLETISPETLTALPIRYVRPVLDALAGAGQWNLTDRFMPLIAREQAWYTDYQKRRGDWVNELAHSAQEAVERGAHLEAEGAAKRALQLAPDNLRAQLILGRIYTATGRLSGARSLIEPLMADPQLGQAAALALAEVDLSSGRLEDARERLRQVSEVEVTPLVAHLRKTVENRMTNTPAIILECLPSRVAADTLRRIPETTWTAFFAVRIVAVRATRGALPLRERCAELMLSFSSFGAQAGAGIEADFVWRYVGSGGKLTAALICRVEGSSETSTRNAARTLWQMIKPLLPLNGAAFAYEPVFSASELNYLRNPLTIESAIEISRKEIVLRTTESPDDEVYLVYPLGLHDDNLLRMLNALSEQPHATLLDIHLKPTEVLSWERRAITEMIQKQGKTDLLAALPELEETSSASTHTPPDFRARLIQQFYPMFLDRMQSLAFVVQIRLGAQGRLDAAMPNIVSMGLFGTSRYEIIRALTEPEMEIMRRNIREITCERWAYSNASSSLERWRYMLTPDEALTASRLPHPGAGGVPGLPVLKIRAISPPDRLPRTGVVLGESLLSEGGRPSLVRLGALDRTRHAYVVGRTGSGKSTLLLNMALQDIEAGRGVGVIDPHGDLIRFLLERIPPHRLHDVVLFDPADIERPVAFNIMDVEDMFEGNMVIADFLGLMRRMFDPYDQGIVGPRFENIIRNSMLALMEVKPGSTLIDVVRFLSDKDYREHIVKSVTDPVVLNYWNNIGKELDKFGWGAAKGDMLDWLTSKFGRFVDDKMVRNIIGQSKSTINFREIMDSGKIMLVDLSKGRVGYQISQFLGLLLVPRLLVAALGRARQQSESRRPFFLYVDEFQSFVTPAFSEMLSEARKFNVSLVVANQFISQLTDEIREAVFGNVGNFFVFQVGIKDGAYLTPELYPAEMEDLVNLPNYHMLVKMLVDGNTVPPFPVRTLPDSHTPNPGLAAKIRDYSRKRYGRDVLIVNQEIQQRFARIPGAESKKPERKGLFDL